MTSFTPSPYDSAEEILRNRSNDIEDVDAHEKKLRSIFGYLSGFEFADRVRIFGSASKDKPVPYDIDVWIDAREAPYNDFSQADAFSILLTLGRKYYPLVDPFVVFSNTILVRNDDCTQWERVKKNMQKPMLASMVQEGVPLSDVLQARPNLAPRPKFRPG